MQAARGRKAILLAVVGEEYGNLRHAWVHAIEGNFVPSGTLFGLRVIHDPA